MSTLTVLGAFPEASAQPLSAIEMDLVPIDLVTEWRRCGMIADFMADYMVPGFEQRETARSVLSTVMNELVENAAKFSADTRSPARASIRHHGEVVHLEVRNEATEKHVQSLRELLPVLAHDEATAVFRQRLQDRRGLGLALLARDYGATVGATVLPAGPDGRVTVCLRVVLSAAEVEQR
ncbi:slr1658 superfamily regulator [Anaeromyxobacter terrae]|uniref:slr1658 superfamily regulator n=1 Tax=Anaeromyxobacter terrae TaxID=2925406 RepID=UPI001F57C2E2|nr:hypothetical protein [Anaeromyxobacter sp. SG22]